MKVKYAFIFYLILSIKAVDQTITINKGNASTFNGGKFQGFGTSFCWRPNRLGYSDVLAEKSEKAFYDKEKGLCLTIIRYIILEVEKIQLMIISLEQIQKCQDIGPILVMKVL